MMNKSTQIINRCITQRVISSDLPNIIVQVNSGLGYLGKVHLNIKSHASAEQFYFAEIIHGKPSKMFIIHFEHFHADNDHYFDYPRMNMVSIGGFEFLQQTWAIMDFELFNIQEVASFFVQSGLSIEPNWLVNRYVTIVDETRKHEFILFYLEPGSTCQVPLSQLQPGAARHDKWPAIEQNLIKRANQVFKLIPK